MLAVVFLLTASVLILVQARMQNQVRADLASTLLSQSRVLAEVDRVRGEQSRQSADIIADQPSIKALMSTNDRLTIEDGSQSILTTSHADLLILENPSGQMMALHSKSSDVTSAMVKPLMQGSTSDEDWWFIARALPRLRSRTEAARWSRRLGRCVGRLQGSLRYRVWYP